MWAGKAGINLITDLCGWRCDFMAPKKAEEICHENRRGENYETSGAINCVVEKLDFPSLPRRYPRGKEEKQKVKPTLRGIT